MRPRKAASDGQALVEMAVALPLLLVASIGLAQFAVYAYAEEVVTGALQDGARVASASGSSVDAGMARAEEIVRAGLGPVADGVAVDGREESGVVTLTATGSLKAAIPWLPSVALPLHARTSIAKERFRAGPHG